MNDIIITEYKEKPVTIIGPGGAPMVGYWLQSDKPDYNNLMVVKHESTGKIIKVDKSRVIFN